MLVKSLEDIAVPVKERRNPCSIVKAGEKNPRIISSALRIVTRIRL